MTPCRVVRPIPLYDEHGRLVRIEKPGNRGFIVSEFETAATKSPGATRAMVRFVTDFATGDSWDVARSSISTPGDP